MKCTPLAKRIVLSSILGILFGCLCFIGFASNPDVPADMLKYTNWSWNNPMMWLIIVNRFTLGFVVGLAGFVTTHPIFGFRMHPLFRGAALGILVSLSLSIGAMMGQDPEMGKQTLIMITVAGAVIGAIIDFVATKAIGDVK